jgi:hypothetical protein
MIELVLHQWKQFRRSGSFGRELGFTIFLSFIAVIVLLSVFALSSSLAEIIPKINDKAAENPILFFNSFLLYYLIGELFLRYFLQNTPALDIQPYLSLPIRKSATVKFLLGKSLVHPLNILSLVLVIPFGKDIILPQFGMIATISWVLSIFTCSLTIHLIIILFKKKLEENIWVWIIIIGIAVINYVSSIFTNIDFTQYWGAMLMEVLAHPYYLVVPVALLFTLNSVVYKAFINNFYLEELVDTNNASSESYSSKLSFLSNYGIIGHLILEEIRMIIRHKRTRSVLFLSLLFLGYGFILFGKNQDSMKATELFASIFISGIFAINYGQFIWSWHTNQLDFFFTKPFAISDWVKSRYQLISIATITSTILAIPYVYFGWEILATLFAATLYNLGINIPLMVRLALWGPKPIDLNKGAFMNYQGTGAAQWIMGFPIVLGPLLVYLPLNLLFNHLAGVAAVGLAGIIGLLFRNFFIQKTTQKLQALKYQLIHQLTI